MKLKNKIKFIIALLIVAIVLSFDIPRRDLQSMSQVAGIALDVSGDRIQATFELYDPAVDQPIGERRKVFSVQGAGLKECVRQAARVHNAQLYLDDASVLILGSDLLVDEVTAYYSELSADHMDLPVFFVKNQSAGEIFEGDGGVVSTHLADSAKLTNRLQTVRDIMNGESSRVYVQGRGGYEILL